MHDQPGLDVPIDSSKAVKINGFYHIFCVNDWKRIVYEQVTSLKKTELYALLNKIYVCVITNKNDDIHYLTDLFPGKFEIVIQSEDPKNYELPILRYIYEKSQCEDFLCFYFHTKGVSISEKNRKGGIESWRLLMEYFIFEKYNLAINTLQNGYSCYGVFQRFDAYNYFMLQNFNGNNYFAGNFWWTTSKYVATLPDPEPEVVNDRYRFFAENWIGFSSENKPFCAYNSSVDIYHIPIPDVLYKNRKTKISDILPILKCYLPHIFGGLRYRLFETIKRKHSKN